jgi:HEAT repeat protein
LKTHLAKNSHLALLAVAFITGCAPPFYPAIYQARDTTHLYNGGLLGKEYELTRDVALVRESMKRPVLAPASPLPANAPVRTAGPSRALGGAWGIWGKQHLAYYRSHCDSPCQTPTEHETVARGVHLRIESIMVEDLEYPPPVFYVQARLRGGSCDGVLVDVSELIEDCVPPDSVWRERPIVANDNYLQPLATREPPQDLAELVKSLDDDNWSVRFRAVQKLADLDTDSTTLLSALLYAKEDRDPEVAYEAIESLGKLGTRADKAVPGLMAAMRRNDKPDGYCRRAAYALASIGRPVSPILTEALRDETWRLRYLAAEGLASMGEKAVPALPVLFELLYSPTEREAHDAPMHIGAAIHRIAPEEGARKLIQMLHDGSDVEQSQAAWALGAFAPAAEEAVEPLMELARKGKSQSRACAIETLGHFGAKAAPAVPILINAIEDSSESSNASLAAVEALGEIGPSAMPAIRAIERYSRHGSRFVRETAWIALQRIHGPAGRTSSDRPRQ